MSDIVGSILEGINTALGGINDLGVTYDEEDEGGTWYIVDRNNTPAESVQQLPIFTLAGVDSIFTDVSISSKISNEIGSQIAIAAQGSTQNYSENVDNILKWNPGVVDRLRTTKDTSSKNKDGVQAVADDRADREEKWVDALLDFFTDFNGSGYNTDDMQTAKTMHAEWTLEHVVKNSRAQKGQPVPGIVPVELSFKMDGIGGFKIGESFRIASGILPSKYQDKFGYIITGLEHSIGTNQRWETSVTTQFILVEGPTAGEAAASVVRGAGEGGSGRERRTRLGGSNDDNPDNNNNLDPETPIKSSKTPPTELIKAMRRYGITAPTERAHFLSQCATESGGFRWKSELWGPTKAQKGYEGRADIGNTQLGDGVKFKGRGYIQITGRANYTKYDTYLKSIGSKADILKNPSALEGDYFAADSACYWWKYLSRNITGLTGGTSPADVRKVSKRVNGKDPANGLADRQVKFKEYWATISKDKSAYA
jgi:putative chitinase